MLRADKSDYPSQREQQILELLTAHQSLTASEIEAMLPDAPSNSTVRSLLTTMKSKGLVDHGKVGRKFVYRAAAPKATTARTVLAGVIQRFFGGSFANAATAFVESGNRLTPEEIEALQRLIDQSRGEQK